MRENGKIKTAVWLLMVTAVIASLFFGTGGSVLAAEDSSEIDYGYEYYALGKTSKEYYDYLKKMFHYSSGCGGTNFGAEESQSYIGYADPVRSNLVYVGGNLMTVQPTKSGKIGIEYYKVSGSFIKSKTITPELPIFGGFYTDGSYFYILSGRTNPSESNSVEVMRVTKYDKNWKKLGNCGLFGANTTDPFGAGTARMIHDGKYLVIHTCHRMYKDKKDGSIHQSNLTFEINTETMKVTDSRTGVSEIKTGYASHSFNQFAQIENHKLVTVDHGDAYPRSVVLVNYGDTVNDGTFNAKCTSTNMINIRGEIGNNNTDTSVGGFEISGKAYIVAAVQKSGSSDSVIVSAKNKSTGKVTNTKIKTYSNGSPSTPHLVRLSDNSYLLMWTYENVVHYIKLDANGSKTGKEYTMTANLSDCKPILVKGKLTWYVRNNVGIRFYQINTSDMKGSLLSNVQRLKSEWVKRYDTLYWCNADGLIDYEITTYWKSDKKGKWILYNGPKQSKNDIETVLGGTYQKHYYYTPAKRWVKIEGKWYYFKENGYIAANEWINGHWLNKGNGAWTYKYKASWKSNKVGTWYEDTSGWYAKSQWEKIDGYYYYFNSKGYRQTGWVTVSGCKFYMDSQGRMQTGWQKIKDKWYYFGGDGIMVAGTTKKISGKPYTFDKNGVCKNK